MAETYWQGSLAFTNGSNQAVVQSGSDPISKIFTNGELEHGQGRALEIESAFNNGSDDIVQFYQTWSASSGTFDCVAKPSAAALQSAAINLEAAATGAQNVVNNTSTSATANSIAQRNSSGQLSVANATSDTQAAAFGQILDRMQDFGVGNTSAQVLIPNNDCDDVIATGVYRCESDTANKPSGWIGFGTLFHQTRNNTQGALDYSQLAIDSTNTMYVRVNNIGVWSDWQEIYHSGNTNFNEFGGNGVNDIVCQGYAGSASAAIFILDVPFIPTSISTTDTFSVRTAGASIVTNGSGVTPSFLGSSSNKACLIQVTGLSGMTAGDVLTLRSDLATSKITVNF